MPTDLSHIELELAPCTEHPFGNRNFTYHLYLPLGPGNRLNLTALQDGESGFVRCCRPHEELRGEAWLEGDGRLAFHFPTRPSNRPLGFASAPDRFIVGRTVGIDEDDGEHRAFQIIAIRRQWPGFVVPKSA
ncbi:MAG TPA: hypothetical protein VHB23_04800 [Devosiaceae bacterium]|jgi:hypothetical protein|nr:hypothetical protein [Devosiaceae bacterium]